MSRILRTFIAIKLDETTIKKLSLIQNDFKKTGADVKWVAPQNIHLTLKFLGDTSEDKIPSLRQVLEKAVAGTSPFLLELTHTGAFPTHEHPQVIWIGITDGKTKLLELASRIEEELFIVGIPKEKRSFDAHVTLGRVRSSLNTFALTKLLKVYSFPAFAQEVKKIYFLKSTLTSHGPIYEPLGTLPL